MNSQVSQVSCLSGVEKQTHTPTFVIHSFSTLKHLFRHGFTKKLLRDCLQIENFSEAPLIVVYNPA